MYGYSKRLFKHSRIAFLRRADARARRSLTSAFGGLPPSLWDCSVGAGGHLEIARLDATRLAAEFGTPLHVVDVARLRFTFDAFLDAFRRHYPATTLATSYKTNPVPFVLGALRDRGADAEVISEFELWLAGRLGLAGERVIVNGPGKNTRMLARAVEFGARIINIDGPGEIAQIAAAAQNCQRRQRVGVRVVTSVGWSSQFGLSIADGSALTAFEAISRIPQLQPAGIHLHLGTGIKNVATYLQAVREALEFGRLLRNRLGIDIDTYDLGGGFGVPTVRTLDPWDVRMIGAGYPAREALPHLCPQPHEYAARIGSLFHEYYPNPDARPAIVLEPGRAITSGTQVLLLSVVAVKRRGKVRQVILDGGKNVSMPLGWETHKIFPASRMSDSTTLHCDLFGPLCHPGDVVARNLQLPPLDPGDVVAIMDAGAYFIPNQMNFSNPRPAIIAVEGGGATLVRDRETFEDVVRLDCLAGPA